MLHLTFSQTGGQRGALRVGGWVGRLLHPFGLHLSRLQRGRTILLPVAQRPLERMRQAGRHVFRPLRPAAPEHSTLQLLPMMFADVQEDVWPVDVRGAVRDVLQVRLGELPTRAQLLDLDVSRSHHQGVIFAQLLPVGNTFQQVADGVLGLLPIQREDFLRSQVVDLEERVAVGQRLRAVAPKSAPERRGRVLEGLHEVESAEGHGAPQAGFGGNFSWGVSASGQPVFFRASPTLPPLFYKWSVVASTAFIWNETDTDIDVSGSIFWGGLKRGLDLCSESDNRGLSQVWSNSSFVTVYVQSHAFASSVSGKKKKKTSVSTSCTAAWKNKKATEQDQLQMWRIQWGIFIYHRCQPIKYLRAGLTRALSSVQWGIARRTNTIKNWRHAKINRRFTVTHRERPLTSVC